LNKVERIEDAKKEVERIETLKNRSIVKGKLMQLITNGMADNEKVEAKQLC